MPPMQGIDQLSTLHGWQKDVYQALLVFGVSQLSHEIMKVRILRVGNPFSAQKPLKDAFHGTGRQQGNLLSIYPQVGGAGAAGEHIPMGRGQEKTGFTVVAPNQFHDSPAHHDPQPLTHIPVVQFRIRAYLRQRTGSPVWRP